MRKTGTIVRILRRGIIRFSKGPTFFNPQSPESDQRQISPCNITAF